MTSEAFEAIKAGLDDAIAYARGDTTRGEASRHEPAGGDWVSRLEVDPNRLGGKPVVRGSRIPAELVVEMVADGWSTERIVASYPTLSPEDVRACLQLAVVALRAQKRFRLSES